jgi:cytoskeleton protein RodZ
MIEAEAESTELLSSPGARLRREREARGLTQQQAAEQLTLDVSVVVALEANDFATLGAPVFARGHLRRYAGMLDLPADDLLGAYARSKGQPEQPTLVPKSRAEMMPVRGPPKWPWVLGGGVAFLFAAGIAAYVSANGLHLPWSADSRSDTEGLAADEPPAADPAVVPQAPSPATLTNGEPAAGTGTVATPAASAAGAAVPAGQVSLHMRFAADSWVEIFDGTGKIVLYDLGKGGSARTVTAVAPLSVTIGNAPAVSVAVNGRAVTTPALPAGQTVARFSVGVNGALR